MGPAVIGVLLDRDEVQVGSDVLREAGRRQLLGTTIPRHGWPRSRLGLNLQGHGRGRHLGAICACTCGLGAEFVCDAIVS